MRDNQQPSSLLGRRFNDQGLSRRLQAIGSRNSSHGNCREDMVLSIWRHIATQEAWVRVVANPNQNGCNFGTIFCQSALSLAEQLWSEMRIKITEEEAQAYLDKFFQTYPGVHHYIENTKKFVMRNNFTFTFTGRRRRFPIIQYSSAVKSRVARQGVNARIQSTSSDLVQTNMVDVDRAIQPLGGRLLLTVHDSIVFQLPKGTPDVRALTDRLIIEETARKFPWLPVPWKYDIGYGPNYGNAHMEP